MNTCSAARAAATAAVPTSTASSWSAESWAATVGQRASRSVRNRSRHPEQALVPGRTNGPIKVLPGRNSVTLEWQGAVFNDTLFCHKGGWTGPEVAIDLQT